jgi:hypothetical protein
MTQKLGIWLLQFEKSDNFCKQTKANGATKCLSSFFANAQNVNIDSKEPIKKLIVYIKGKTNQLIVFAS